MGLVDKVRSDTKYALSIGPGSQVVRQGVCKTPMRGCNSTRASVNLTHPRWVKLTGKMWWGELHGRERHAGGMPSVPWTASRSERQFHSGAVFQFMFGKNNRKSSGYRKTVRGIHDAQQFYLSRFVLEENGLIPQEMTDDQIAQLWVAGQNESGGILMPTRLIESTFSGFAVRQRQGDRYIIF